MNYKLLVAEDVSEERSALVSTLKKHLTGAVTILEARDGREALNLCRQEKPDVLILNIEMPFFSGWMLHELPGRKIFPAPSSSSATMTIFPMPGRPLLCGLWIIF